MGTYGALGRGSPSPFCVQGWQYHQDEGEGFIGSAVVEPERHRFGTGTLRPRGKLVPSVIQSSGRRTPIHVAHMTTQQLQHVGPSRLAVRNENDSADEGTAAWPPEALSSSSPSPSSPGRNESEVGLVSTAAR